MRKFVTLDCLIDSSDNVSSPSHVQSLRQAVLTPVSCRVNILRSLQKVNFKFHRPCSLTNLIRECNVAEGRTLLTFWGCHQAESKATMSMCASSCSSLLHIQNSGQPSQPTRELEVKSTAQQTEISCRHSSVNIVECDGIGLRAHLAEPLAFSSPASSVLQPAGRSMSILGSVCALLLNKQGSPTPPPKESSVPDTRHSEHICRICFGGESAERLVRPCSCRGTIAAVHRSCLERWLLQAASSYCELCRHHYAVTRSHKWSWVRSAAEWVRSGRGRALAADAWRGAALGAASVLGTARALHACDRVLQAGARRGGGPALAANLLSSLIIGVIGALNGLLTTWMLLKIQEHQMSWQAWRDSTLHVHVTLADATPSPSDVTVVGGAAAAVDRGTNIADPFMVDRPFAL